MIFLLVYPLESGSVWTFLGSRIRIRIILDADPQHWLAVSIFSFLIFKNHMFKRVEYLIFFDISRTDILKINYHLKNNKFYYICMNHWTYLYTVIVLIKKIQISDFTTWVLWWWVTTFSGRQKHFTKTMFTSWVTASKIFSDIFRTFYLTKNNSGLHGKPCRPLASQWRRCRIRTWGRCLCRLLR